MGLQKHDQTIKELEIEMEDGVIQGQFGSTRSTCSCSTATAISELLNNFEIIIDFLFDLRTCSELLGSKSKRF